MNIGDSIFEIYSTGGKLHIIKVPILSISKKGLIGCRFNIRNGFKISSLNQFNLTTGLLYNDDNFLPFWFYHCYSLLPELEQNILLFCNRYKKVMGEYPCEFSKHLDPIITDSKKIKSSLHPNYLKRYSITNQEYKTLINTLK